MTNWSNYPATDKHKFWHIYPAVLDFTRPVHLLELGVWAGDSLRVWQDTFAPGSKIVGADVDLHRVVIQDVEVCYADMRDGAALLKISQRHAPAGWDIIIDDASHRAEDSRAAFAALWPLLKAGGFYFVEDIECPGLGAFVMELVNAPVLEMRLWPGLAMAVKI